MNPLRRLFCRHLWVWFRNLHGDEIQHTGGQRSLWFCPFCKAVHHRRRTHYPTAADTLMSDAISAGLRADIAEGLKRLGRVLPGL